MFEAIRCCVLRSPTLLQITVIMGTQVKTWQSQKTFLKGKMENFLLKSLSWSWKHHYSHNTVIIYWFIYLVSSSINKSWTPSIQWCECILGCGGGRQWSVKVCPVSALGPYIEPEGRSVTIVMCSTKTWLHSQHFILLRNEACLHQHAYVSHFCGSTGRKGQWTRRTRDTRCFGSVEDLGQVRLRDLSIRVLQGEIIVMTLCFL